MEKIIGYYIEKDGTLDVKDIFVAIDTGGKRLKIYSPVYEHSEADREYLNECTIILKEQYKQVSKGYYTPKEYV